MDKSWLSSKIAFPFYYLGPPPPLRWVNRESCEETLKTYMLVDARSGRPLCFKEWQDTIYLESSIFWYDIVNLTDVEIDKTRAGSRIRSLVIHRALMPMLYNYWTSERKRCGISELFVIDYASSYAR